MKFTGVMPALITPLTEDGKLNREVLEKLIEDLMGKPLSEIQELYNNRDIEA